MLSRVREPSSECGNIKFLTIDMVFFWLVLEAVCLCGNIKFLTIDMVLLCCLLVESFPLLLEQVSLCNFGFFRLFPVLGAGVSLVLS